MYTMKPALFILVLLIIFIVNSIAFSKSLSLQDCLHRAQQYSYILKSDMQRRDAMENRFEVEKSRSLPQISGELSGEQRYLTPFSFRQSWALVHADWSLGNFLLNTPRAARQDALAVTAQTEQTRLEVFSRTALLYLSILQKQTHNSVLQKRFELLKIHHDVADALWQTGTRTRLDVLQTESEMLQLQEQMAILDIERENLWQELSILIRWETSEIPQFSPLEAAEICAGPLPEPEGEFLVQHPLLQVFSYRVEAENIRREAVTAQQLPHLYAAGGYFADGDPSGDGNYWRVDAGLSLPLFQWGAFKFTRQKSEATIRSIEAGKMDMEQELTIQIQQILQRLEKLKNVLALQENRIQTTDKAYRFAESNYQAGFITNLDYLSTQQQLAESHIALRETQLEYVINLVEFYIVTNQADKIGEFY